MAFLEPEADQTDLFTIKVRKSETSFLIKHEGKETQEYILEGEIIFEVGLYFQVQTDLGTADNS